MNRISQPVLVLVVVGVVLGLFALAGGKHARQPSRSAGSSPAPAPALKGAAVPRDAKAALQNIINLLNKDDAAGLQAQMMLPCYIDGRKIEDEQSLKDFIQKAVEREHAYALEAAVQTTALEAGLPPEAGEVLTSNDTILVADLRSSDETVRRIFIFRNSGGPKLLALLRAPEQ